MTIAKAIFLFGGEGAHSADPDLSVLKQSPSWTAVDTALHGQYGVGVEDFLAENAGKHSCPGSPVVTTVLNILQADIWRMWGHSPAYALGHSVRPVAQLSWSCSQPQLAVRVCRSARSLRRTCLD